jgi:threonine/homoserine/homoserine lactone efflux protein
VSLPTLLAFVAASAVIGLTPGPGVSSIVGYALGRGTRTALFAAAGMTLGNAIAMSLSLAGAGALLVQSALAYAVLKGIGAAYLIGLGIRKILGARKLAEAAAEAPAKVEPKPLEAFASTLLIGATHPKTVLFFAAFAPQFISPKGDYAAKAALLTVIFCATTALTDSAYALLASRAAPLIRKPALRRWAERTGGAVMIGAGASVAALRP